MKKPLGRPRLYEPSPFQGAPQITVRMPPDLLAWVKEQGGAVFLRQLAEQARARDPLTEALTEALVEDVAPAPAPVPLTESRKPGPAEDWERNRERVIAMVAAPLLANPEGINLKAIAAQAGFELGDTRELLIIIAEGLPTSTLRPNYMDPPVYLEEKKPRGEWVSLTYKSKVLRLKAATEVRLTDRGRKLLNPDNPGNG